MFFLMRRRISSFPDSIPKETCQQPCLRMNWSVSRSTVLIRLMQVQGKAIFFSASSSNSSRILAGRIVNVSSTKAISRTP